MITCRLPRAFGPLLSFPRDLCPTGCTNRIRIYGHGTPMKEPWDDSILTNHARAQPTFQLGAPRWPENTLSPGGANGRYRRPPHAACHGREPGRSGGAAWLSSEDACTFFNQHKGRTSKKPPCGRGTSPRVECHLELHSNYLSSPLAHATMAFRHGSRVAEGGRLSSHCHKEHRFVDEHESPPSVPYNQERDKPALNWVKSFPTTKSTP